jgi:hypothetical protein
MRNLKILTILGPMFVGYTVCTCPNRSRGVSGLRGATSGVRVWLLRLLSLCMRTYGYYGPSWFAGGIFIGAGPWARGRWGHGYYGRGGFYGDAATTDAGRPIPDAEDFAVGTAMAMPAATLTVEADRASLVVAEAEADSMAEVATSTVEAVEVSMAEAEAWWWAQVDSTINSKLWRPAAFAVGRCVLEAAEPRHPVAHAEPAVGEKETGRDS